MNNKVVLGLLTLFLFIAVSQSISHEIHVHLEVTNFEINVGEIDEFPIKLTYENRGELISLPHFAVVEDDNILSYVFDIFSVDTGKKAVYKGAIAKRSIAHTPFISFSPSHSVTSQVNLLKHYHFEEDGTYLIQLNAAIPLLDKESIQLTSNAVEVVINGSSPFVFESHKRAVPYYGCTTSESIIVSQQKYNQLDALANAYVYLSNYCINSDYTTFFGTYSDTRYNTVYYNFFSIYYLAYFELFEIQCGDGGVVCSPSLYAYVYPTDTTNHLIYLCDLFWTAADYQYSYDSKAGTLTHEMSHFNDVAGTLDYVYGYANAVNFATTNPDLSTNNADNHKYFQESQPNCSGGVVNLHPVNGLFDSDVDCYFNYNVGTYTISNLNCYFYGYSLYESSNNFSLYWYIDHYEYRIFIYGNLYGYMKFTLSSDHRVLGMNGLFTVYGSYEKVAVDVRSDVLLI